MSKHAVAEAAGDVTEQLIETTLDVVETVPTVVKNNPVVLVSVAVISLAVGATVATLVANKRLKTKYDKLAHEEIQQAKRFYAQKNKDGEFSDPSILAEKYLEDSDNTEQPYEGTPDEDVTPDMVRTAAKILEDQHYVSYDKVKEKLADLSPDKTIEVKTTISENVFDMYGTSVSGDYDLDVELDKKNAGRPYIIEGDLFRENPDDHPQTQLNWYAGDEILADEHEEPITNIEGVIGGMDNLKFGYGSEDPEVVYITNARFESDYEVTRNPGYYTVEVLGNDLEHSDRPRLRKMRRED